MSEEGQDMTNTGPGQSGGHRVVGVGFERKRTVIHVGPLPAPEDLEAYERACSGAAGRILDLAEKEQAHRHKLEQGELANETTLVNTGTMRVKLGLVSGTLVVLSTLGVSAYLAYLGQGLVSFTPVLIEIGALAGVFIYGTHSRKKERIEKAKIMASQPPVIEEEDFGEEDD